jgi:hypothetical protein
VLVGFLYSLCAARELFNQLFILVCFDQLACQLSAHTWADVGFLYMAGRTDAHAEILSFFKSGSYNNMAYILLQLGNNN